MKKLLLGLVLAGSFEVSVAMGPDGGLPTQGLMNFSDQLNAMIKALIFHGEDKKDPFAELGEIANQDAEAKELFTQMSAQMTEKGQENNVLALFSRLHMCLCTRNLLPNQLGVSLMGVAQETTSAFEAESHNEKTSGGVAQDSVRVIDDSDTEIEILDEGTVPMMTVQKEQKTDESSKTSSIPIPDEDIVYPKPDDSTASDRVARTTGGSSVRTEEAKQMDVAKETSNNRRLVKFLRKKRVNPPKSIYRMNIDDLEVGKAFLEFIKHNKKKLSFVKVRFFLTEERSSPKECEDAKKLEGRIKAAVKEINDRLVKFLKEKRVRPGADFRMNIVDFEVGEAVLEFIKNNKENLSFVKVRFFLTDKRSSPQECEDAKKLEERIIEAVKEINTRYVECLRKRVVGPRSPFCVDIIDLEEGKAVLEFIERNKENLGDIKVRCFFKDEDLSPKQRKEAKKLEERIMEAVKEINEINDRLVKFLREEHVKPETIYRTNIVDFEVGKAFLEFLENNKENLSFVKVRFFLTDKRSSPQECEDAKKLERRIMGAVKKINDRLVKFLREGHVKPETIYRMDIVDFEEGEAVLEFIKNNKENLSFVKVRFFLTDECSSPKECEDAKKLEGRIKAAVKEINDRRVKFLRETHVRPGASFGMGIVDLEVGEAFLKFIERNKENLSNIKVRFFLTDERSSRKECEDAKKLEESIMSAVREINARYAERLRGRVVQPGTSFFMDIVDPEVGEAFLKFIERNKENLSFVKVRCFLTDERSSRKECEDAKELEGRIRGAVKEINSRRVKFLRETHVRPGTSFFMSIVDLKEGEAFLEFLENNKKNLSNIKVRCFFKDKDSSPEEREDAKKLEESIMSAVREINARYVERLRKYIARPGDIFMVNIVDLEVGEAVLEFIKRNKENLSNTKVRCFFKDKRSSPKECEDAKKLEESIMEAVKEINSRRVKFLRETHVRPGADFRMNIADLEVGEAVLEFIKNNKENLSFVKVRFFLTDERSSPKECEDAKKLEENIMETVREINERNMAHEEPEKVVAPQSKTGEDAASHNEAEESEIKK